MKILIDTYTTLGLAVIAYMTTWFFAAIIEKRNDLADIAWGLGFLFVTVITYIPGGLVFDRGFLALILVAIWAGRLSTHIYLRNRGKSEDYRYAAWRKEWGNFFYVRTYLQVFLLQGFFLLLVSSPAIMATIFRGTNWSILDMVGVVVWGVGFFFESVGDLQLARFIKNPMNKGRIMRDGLWQYTRHPNYFGEVTQWWGIWLIALSTPYGWLSIIGPVTITFLILKVSGIPLLEARMMNNPEFEEYKKKTNTFFPWKPRP